MCDRLTIKHSKLARPNQEANQKKPYITICYKHCAKSLLTFFAKPMGTPLVGVFSCPIAPVPACCWGFLRTPADFASRPNWQFRATFHSLLAIPRSDLAPWNWPEVRKGRQSHPYRSKSYARTNQAVGLQHWGAKETLRLRFVGSCRTLPTHCNTDVRACMMAKRD